LGRFDAPANAHRSTADWLESLELRPDAAATFEAIVHVGTYAGDLRLLSADAAISNLQMGLKHGVDYLHGGWQQIVDALIAKLGQRGVEPSMGAPVITIEANGDRWTVATEAISAPTLVLHTVENRMVPIEHGRHLAQHIPNARLVELPGADSALFFGSAAAPVVIDEVEEFLTGTRTTAERTRMLTTRLFTDVVGSTDRLAAVGDQAWRTVLDRLDEALRRQLARFSGHEERLTGDGILATFDGPARAIRCGTAIRDAARQIGLDVRVGIHTGEVERRGTELAGVAVHLACRVCETAQPGEVLVSRTVVDLVAGSGTTFDDRGEHDLKGIPAAWRLFAVTT
jgi:class 3 adenylate cyclase